MIDLPVGRLVDGAPDQHAPSALDLRTEVVDLEADLLPDVPELGAGPGAKDDGLAVQDEIDGYDERKTIRHGDGEPADRLGRHCPQTLRSAELFEIDQIDHAAIFRRQSGRR